MRIEYAAYISTACLTLDQGRRIWSKISKWWDLVAKISTPLVQATEQMSKDGKVDKSDRKKLVMMAVDAILADRKIKLNFITRVIVSKIVDRIAEKLPDFTISQTAVEIIGKQNVLVK